MGPMSQLIVYFSFVPAQKAPRTCSNIYRTRMTWTLPAPTLDLTAKMILGRATMRHLRAMVIYFSTKSAMPTIHSKSKKSRGSTLGFRNMRLEERVLCQGKCRGVAGPRAVPSTSSHNLLNIYVF